MCADEMVKSPMTALVYAAGDPPPQRLLRALADHYRAGGCGVAGVIEHPNGPGGDAPSNRCDVRLEVLGTHDFLDLSEDRGRGARGCRLDTDALLRAVQLTQAALDHGAGILLVNKFGKMEAEGGGFRSVIGEAVARGIPVVIGVPARNLEAFRAFAGGLAVEIQAADWHQVAGAPSRPVAGVPHTYGL